LHGGKNYFKRILWEVEPVKENDHFVVLTIAVYKNVSGLLYEPHAHNEHIIFKFGLFTCVIMPKRKPDRMLDDVTRREFLRVIGGMAILASGGSAFADDLDLPITRRVAAPLDPPDVPPVDVPPVEPPVFYNVEIPNCTSLFYVIDKSGSMWNDTLPTVDLDGTVRNMNKMDRAKREVKRSVQGLDDRVQFNISDYNCGVRAWRPHLEYATPDNKRDACRWVDSISPDGGTGTGPAVSYALLQEPENYNVVLLTDGDPNCGVDTTGPDPKWVRHQRMINLANRQRARIYVFGISASGDYRIFCQGVAADSNGTYTDVQ